MQRPNGTDPRSLTAWEDEELRTAVLLRWAHPWAPFIGCAATFVVSASLFALTRGNFIFFFTAGISAYAGYRFVQVPVQRRKAIGVLKAFPIVAAEATATPMTFYGRTTLVAARIRRHCPETHADRFLVPIGKGPKGAAQTFESSVNVHSFFFMPREGHPPISVPVLSVGPLTGTMVLLTTDLESLFLTIEMPFDYQRRRASRLLDGNS